MGQSLMRYFKARMPLRLASIIVSLTLAHAGLSATEPPAVVMRANEVEQADDPVFGEVGNHLGAAILIDGFRDGASPVGFHAADAPVESVMWQPPWMGKPKANFFRFYAHATPLVWQEFDLRIVPDADGQIDVTLIGTGGSHVWPDGKWNIDNPNWTYFDRVSCTGAKLDNGDFEEVDGGVPVGWSVVSKPEYDPALVDNPGVAVSGRRCIKVGNWFGYRQTLRNVRKGEPITLSYVARTPSIERDFNVRIGLSGIDNPEPIALRPLALPPNSLLLSVNRWRGEWGPNPVHDIPRTGREGAMAFEMRAGGDWTETEIVFLPTASGDVEMTLHGARIEDRHRGLFVPRVVQYDDIRVEGAKLTNASFEEIGDDGLPVGWRRVGRERQSMILNNDSEQAAVGRHFVSVWYEAGLRATLTGVEKDRPVRLRLKTRRSPAVGQGGREPAR